MSTKVVEIPGTKTGFAADTDFDTELQAGAIRQRVAIRDGNNALAIDGNGALSLPAGAASDAKLQDVIAAIDAIPAAPGTVTVSNFPMTQPVSGPLTDAELRNAPVAVTGPLSDTQLRAAPVAVSGPATDTQLRATPLPVSVSGVATAAAQSTGNTSLASNDGKTPTLVGGAVPVTGALTDTQLRATPIVVTGTLEVSNDVGNALPVSMSDQPTATKQDTGNTSLGTIATQTTNANAAMGAVGEAADIVGVGTTKGMGFFRGMVQLLASLLAKFTLGAGTATAAVRTTLASDDPAVAVLGTTSGAAVVTNANGTIQQFLRGVVTLLARPTSSTTASVSASATAITLLAANANRRGCVIQAKTAATTYVLLGSGTPSSTNYTFTLANDDVVTLDADDYSGIIKAISASATGSFLVTEFS